MSAQVDVSRAAVLRLLTLQRTAHNASVRTSHPPLHPARAAISAQSIFLAFLLLAPGDAFTSSVAGLVPFPPDFRGTLCLCLLANMVVSWTVDAAAGWAYARLQGRRCCGMTVR